MNSYNFIKYFPNGIVYAMNEVSPEKTLEIFDDLETIETFDLMLVNNHIQMYVSPLVENIYNTDKENYIKKIARILLMKFYKNWKKIKSDLSATYDVLNVGKTERITKNKQSENTENKTDNIQYQTNAFNDNTQKTDTDNEITKNERSFTSSENGTTERVVTGTEKTQSELIKSDVKLYRENVFYDIIENDIISVLTLDTY